MYRYE
jgi:hypothetical protein